MLNPVNPVQIFTFYFLKIHFNTTLPSMLCLLSCLFPCNFLTEMLYTLLPFLAHLILESLQQYLEHISVAANYVITFYVLYTRQGRFMACAVFAAHSLLTSQSYFGSQCCCMLP